MVKVINAGFYTSLQDMGREGNREFGIPSSGAMDQYSAKLANALLGNFTDDALLEVTLIGPILEFNCQTSICITGAHLTPKINDEYIKLNQAVSVRAGDVLSFGKLVYGYRSYISVAGGFKVSTVLNSRSMYAGITPKNRIEAGDVINISEGLEPLSNAYSTIRLHSNLFNETMLRVFKGPEFDLMPKNLVNKLITTEFTVSKNNNRMGYQLEQELKNNLNSILTSPVLPGTVQLTPDGKLIVLMRDGQTTGGYPRVLQLKEASLNVLGQKKAGDSVKFQF